MAHTSELFTDLRNAEVVDRVVNGPAILPTQCLDAAELRIFDRIVRAKTAVEWERMPLDIELATTLARYIVRHQRELDTLMAGDMVVGSSFGPKVTPRLAVINQLLGTILRLQFRLGIASTTEGETKVRGRKAADQAEAIRALTEDEECLIPRIGARALPAPVGNPSDRSAA